MNTQYSNTKTFFVCETFAEKYNANDVRMAMDLHYYYGDCTTPEAQAQIKQNFIQILNESLFKQVCQDPVFKDKCKADNVKVTCSVVVSVTSRRKRAAGMVKSQGGGGGGGGGVAGLRGYMCVCVCGGGGGVGVDFSSWGFVTRSP